MVDGTVDVYDATTFYNIINYCKGDSKPAYMVSTLKSDIAESMKIKPSDIKQNLPLQ